MDLLDKILKGTKNTSNLVKLEIKKKNLDKELNTVIKNIIFNKDYKEVTKDGISFICLEAQKILKITEELKKIENQINHLKNSNKELLNEFKSEITKKKDIQENQNVDKNDKKDKTVNEG